MTASGRHVSHGRASGFSLLEVLVVMLIIATISVLAAAAVTGGFAGMRLRSDAKEIAAQLRYTRAQAIATGRTQRFVIDPAAHAWSAAGDRKGEIPEQFAVTFIGAREVQPQQGQGAILFFHDGASTGGRVQLAWKRSAWDVNVAWLTGEVKVVRGEVVPP